MRSLETHYWSPPHAPQHCVIRILAADFLLPVAEALHPRSDVITLCRGPIPPEVRPSVFIEAADRRAVLEHHVQLLLGRQAPVRVAVGIQLRSTIYGRLPP